MLIAAFPDLPVCKSAAQAFIDQIDKYIEWYNKKLTEKDKGKASTSSTAFYQLEEKAKAFESVLLAELQTFQAFVTTQQGIYSTTDLIQYAEKMFPESIRNKLDGKIVEEIRSSGRCLVFDSPTASGFHILRATELVLHQYYLAICKPECNDALDNWGAYITALTRVSQTRLDIKKMVAMIQQIKDSDRNLIMHPEVVLTPDQAFTLFETAKSVIMAMAEKLPDPKTKKHERKRKGISKA